MTRPGGDLRQQLATIFEDEEPRSIVTRLFNSALALLIVINVVCVILESVESIRQQFALAFDLFEHAVTAIFAVEYALRVWTCVDFHDRRYRDPLWGRLRYMRSFFALVDLVAVLPAVIGFFGAADLRVLRLLRLLRMLKLVRHSTTFGLLFAVLREERQSIMALLFVVLLTVTISASLMYMIENEVQPGVFSSIPVAMWWAVETLTTVGYGDIVPMTVAGRIVGGCVSIVGIGTLALFSGLITVGFLDQLRIYRESHPKTTAGAAGKSGMLAQNLSAKADEAVGAATRNEADLEPRRNLSETPGVCPHCGRAILASPQQDDANDAPTGG